MAIVEKRNYLIPVIQINGEENPGGSLMMITYKNVIDVNAGIDPTQFTGSVTFNREAEEVTISNGRIFIKNLDAAVSELGPYLQIKIWGGRDGNTGFINGTRIWKGKGTSYGVVDRSNLLREGWNDIVMNVGGIIIKGPFLKEN